MQVYCQPTEYNQRLCSLMSAVLQRSIRPHYTPAIQAKAQRVRTGNRQSIAMMFVGGVTNDARAHHDLIQSTCEFARQYQIDATSLPARGLARQKLRQRLVKWIHLESQKERSMFLVVISKVGLDLVSDLIHLPLAYTINKSNTQDTPTNILDRLNGIALIVPQSSLDQGQSLALSVHAPILALLPTTSMTTVQNFLTNPHTISVPSRAVDYYGSGDEDDDDDEEEEDPRYRHALVWLARTIVKFAEGITWMDQGVRNESNQQIESNREEASFPNGMSRL